MVLESGKISQDEEGSGSITNLMQDMHGQFYNDQGLESSSDEDEANRLNRVGSAPKQASSVEQEEGSKPPVEEVSYSNIYRNNLVTEYHLALMYNEKTTRNNYHLVAWKENGCCKNGCTDMDKKVRRFIPILDWLPNYNVKENLRNDFVTGLTIGVMLVPQGISYGLLADLPAEYGLYASLAAPIVYSIFGTSIQNQLGPFALISLLVSNTVRGVVDPDTNMDEYIQCVLVCSILVGVLLTLMGILRLGSLVNFLAIPVISGLTTGGAFLIMTSQISKFLGIDISRGKFFPTWVEVFKNVGNINVATFIIGMICLVILMAFREFKTTRFAVKTHLRHVPIQLVVLVLSILVTWGLELDDKYGVKILGDVPHGIPAPAFPTQFSRFGELIVPSVVISIVGYSLSMASGKTFAAKNQYEISSNQELFALGFANIITGMFNGYPAFASLSRSALVHELGAKTPLHNLFSSLVIVLVLTFLTANLYYLPYTCLAAIIFDSLKSLFLQLKDPVKLWHEDKRDMVIWLVTFFGVLLLDVAIGLAVGVAFSILVLLYSISHPSYAVIGRFPKLPSIFKDLNRFSDAVEVPGVVVFRFDSALHFANREDFREHILEAVAERAHKNKEVIHSVVLDASSITDCDSTGLACLAKLQQELSALQVELILCNCRGRLRDILRRSKISFQEYLRISDAVAYAEGKKVMSFVGIEEDDDDDAQSVPSTSSPRARLTDPRDGFHFVMPRSDTGASSQPGTQQQQQQQSNHHQQLVEGGQRIDERNVSEDIVIM